MMPSARISPLNGTKKISQAASSVDDHFLVGHAEKEQRYIQSLCSVELDNPHWLIFSHTEPAIIMGRSQRPSEGQIVRASGAGLSLVGRKSGGGAVMAGPELLSVTIFFPPQHSISKASTVVAYNWMGSVWQQVLAALGIESRFPELTEIRRSQQQAKSEGISWACFSSVSHGELLSMAGRKLLGIAQIRNRYCTALTSGIHLHQPDWLTLSEVLTGQYSHAAPLKKINTSIHDLAGAKVNELARKLPQQINKYLIEEIKRLQQ